MPYEKRVGAGKWCDNNGCLVPPHTMGIMAKEEAGVGSIWRCGKCGRRWKLLRLNGMLRPSLWEPVEE